MYFRKLLNAKKFDQNTSYDKYKNFQYIEDSMAQVFKMSFFRGNKKHTVKNKYFVVLERDKNGRNEIKIVLVNNEQF